MFLIWITLCMVALTCLAGQEVFEGYDSEKIAGREAWQEDRAHRSTVSPRDREIRRMLRNLSTTRTKAAGNEIKARPFTTVSLPCEFTFIERSDGLQFTWNREDITEEIKVYEKDPFTHIKEEKIHNPRNPKLLFSYRNNAVVPEGDSHEYEGRVKVDPSRFGAGVLTLQLMNVSFEDEGVYSCKARGSDGLGERIMNLLVEDEEEPQVQVGMVDNGVIASCISMGWYNTPIVTWSNGTSNFTNSATTRPLVARPDGTQQVLSILYSPGKVHGIYHCLIREAEKVQRPRILIKTRYPYRVSDYSEYY